ncbi:hypothetical protein EMIHUDRAFT_440921 [Emiliania huxleyi CCMP1516]|uniref:Uncharacterized protein n=3 Tax=Emiliania huxleyi TaxID=2903 RepID=A0A0D3ICP9_EMIH1|nr:hypothetical protein EMIHUDRAFT_438170 [Emiliania huxleyi CCMP1516]XP_005788040.1 hypothetical protein EMIHUDRAFT_440921 [Emiliania huxleyi CCMP1516]EOD09034.1 hypothetical protein EMIHUDRAFT_438170 [Emiliania huxleyi CCMP1516]EOD35611.1 hypothetical protein EMIHUDRAFT_440921 [Emiliania huxleyi CCMP1516]|eukprot:XP_005761463.1 hypothetical protein EMIHUDRAFT_438170 [Emiliania huxleyi CCMP1516]
MSLRHLMGEVASGDVVGKLKAAEAKWLALTPHLAESLKPIAAQATKVRETYEAFAAAQPELLKSIIGRVEKDPLCTGVVPTVAAARDPSQCKYTVEGTLVHDIMTNVKLLERREASAYDGLEYKLTEAEKKSIITNSVAFLSSQNTKVLAGLKESLPAEKVKELEAEVASSMAKAVASVKPSDLPDSMPFKDVLKMH